MYLVDTNVWLERLLDQARAEEVGQFLERIPSNQLFISDFAFHSIGVVLTRLGRADALVLFVRPVLSSLQSAPAPADLAMATSPASLPSTEYTIPARDAPTIGASQNSHS